MDAQERALMEHDAAELERGARLIWIGWAGLVVSILFGMGAFASWNKAGMAFFGIMFLLSAGYIYALDGQKRKARRMRVALAAR